jgi:hypothetical protein
MTTTSNVSFGAVAVWGSASAAAGRAVSNPNHADTTMVGGNVQFENDNYRITMGDDNTVTIQNKNTGETYQAWGDPHMNVDGKQAFDFWGTTTIKLDDGTKVTIETTPWANNPSMTLSSKVTITNGDYGVQVSGIDTNRSGDLKFEEAEGWGRMADAVVADGNTIYENPAGAGFVGFDRNGNLRAVDQQYIDETDLMKGGAVQQRWNDALRQLTGLVAVSMLGSFAAGVAEDLGDAEPRSTQPVPRAADSQLEVDAMFALVVTRQGAQVSWFAGAAAALHA